MNSHFRELRRILWLGILVRPVLGQQLVEGRIEGERVIQAHEQPAQSMGPVNEPPYEQRNTSVAILAERDGFHSVQVNVDRFGWDVLGDAANEPSIAIDPTDARRIVIGWRQFNRVNSDFRQAGWAYSHDAGHTWVFSGVLDATTEGSDPILDSDAEGNIYYHSIHCPGTACGDLYISRDGGVTWEPPCFTYAGDKPWMAIDRTNGIGHGNVYIAWGSEMVRSTDGGSTFDTWSNVHGGIYGTITVAPDGTVYSIGIGRLLRVSLNAADPSAVPVFGSAIALDLGGSSPSSINGSGLVNQPWVAADHSYAPSRGNIYVLQCVRPRWSIDPADVMFIRSVDGGLTWSAPVRVNDDPRLELEDAWQWFGLMSVAPNGRIDAVWNDTRSSLQEFPCELYYAYSADTGRTWSENVPVSPLFDHTVGWPKNSGKLGDYYHMLSDNLGVNVAYAATFNGEQDIYFLRIGPWDCNGNEIPDDCDLDCHAPACSVPICDVKPNSHGVPGGTLYSATYFPPCIGDAAYTGIENYLDGVEQVCGRSLDCNGNSVPDECEFRGDFDGDNLTTLRDMAAMQRCYSNVPSSVSNSCCSLFDLEPDGDVDLEDFKAVQRVHFGP